uniref:Uncharacterized protein n=1 Tax=Cacopsylla melanoneura TaxID=428564 RepID=A0A8D8ZJK5_9HEMI
MREKKGGRKRRKKGRGREIQYMLSSVYLKRRKKRGRKNGREEERGKIERRDKIMGSKKMLKLFTEYLWRGKKYTGITWGFLPAQPCFSLPQNLAFLIILEVIVRQEYYHSHTGHKNLPENKRKRILSAKEINIILS